MTEESAPNHQESSHKDIFRYLASVQAKAIKMLENSNQSAAMALSEKNLKDIDEALKAFPDSADFHALKGYSLKDIYQSSKNLLSNKERQVYLRRAHESFNRALELDQNNASAHNGMGNVLFFQEHYYDAMEEHEKALKLTNGYYPAADHDKLLVGQILRRIQEKANSTYQQLESTPVGEIAYIIKNELQKWNISDQERMDQSVNNIAFSLKTKIPENQANRHIYEKIEDIKKEKDLVKQYELVAILIGSISQIVIGGNMSGDIYSNVHIKGNGNVVGSNNVISINQQSLRNIPEDYAKSLQAFSEAVNTQLENNNISQEKAAPVQESINELVIEVEGIKPEEKINLEKKEDIKAKITKVGIRLMNLLPKGAETVATFTPLAPFSKIIGEGVEEIMKAIQEKV